MYIYVYQMFINVYQCLPPEIICLLGISVVVQTPHPLSLPPPSPSPNPLPHESHLSLRCDRNKQ